MNLDFYQGKRVLITGHTGFKGSWLFAWLDSIGAKVLGFAQNPPTNPSLFKELQMAKSANSHIGDIRNYPELLDSFNKFKPEIVFHLAAQPLVRLSYFEPTMTYSTNVMGTLNVLEAARACGSVVAFVNVTTDKCYENREVRHAYTESEPMGGYDMYSSSKGCVEIMSASYRRCFLRDGYSMATARAGNVIGGGDWADDRLIPDCIKAIESERPIEIRSPHSVRPWQYVLEPLYGYLLLGQKLCEDGAIYAEGFNFGPDSSNILEVGEVVEKVISEFGKGEMLVRENDALHEANLLMLDIGKVRERLGWRPTYSAHEAVKKTVEWYKNFYAGKPARELTLNQIAEFQDKIEK